MELSNNVVLDDKKQFFNFFFDKENNFHCINTYKGHHRHYVGNDARRKLDYIDYNNYNKIILDPDRIKLESDENSVTIDGASKFYKQKYHFDMQRTHRKLNKHFRFRLVKENEFDLSNNKVLNFNKIVILTNEYKKKIAFKGGYFVLLGALTLGGFAYGSEKLSSIEFVTDKIEYDESLLDAGGKDYSINYYYEPATFELLPQNYEDFDAYTNETALAYDSYYDIVKEEADRWGVDPNLVMAMLIQESHGKGKNIMQISYSAWNGGKVKLYDFVDNKYVDILFTNNKSRENETTICISSEDFSNPQMNVRMACAILRHSIERMDDHIMAGLQNYNFGDGNMDTVINHAASDLNMSKSELLSDQNNLDFANYVHFASGGDKHYINNVLKYIKDVDSLYYKDIDQYGNIVEYRYDINVKEKTK